MFGHIPFDAAGGASPAEPPLLLPRGSPTYLKEVPKVLAYLGSSVCVSTPFQGPLSFVVGDWALGKNGALVSTSVVFPLRKAKAALYACWS